jgi:pyruvate dehydrogenase E2 component (dihydrolipoamide acetyltransferase)
MAIEITIPRLGWSMDEGIFGEWLVPDGEFVESGAAIFTMESEKALQEVESVDSGILRLVENAPQEGDEVLVGLLVGWLLEEGEEPPSSPIEDLVETSADPVLEIADSAIAEASSQPSVRSNNRTTPAISPRAKRVAQETNVDWTQLTGSGSTGRIREKDVRAAASVTSPISTQATTATRRTIASRMKESLAQTAPVTLTTKADATALVNLRTQLKAAAEKSAPSYTDIVIKLLAKCLERHPALYAQWTGQEITQPSCINIGVAVDTDEGLMVPVVKDVPRLSLGAVAEASRSLIEKARDRQLSASEMTDGVFSVSNLGAYGIDAFTPIINYPETAILGLGTIRREAMVDSSDQIVPRDQITLSLTFDHRVIDGAPAAAFLKNVREAIENASAWLID